MVRGGKVSGKRTFRKKVRSKEGGSDDSDEDYVVSDEDRDVSDYYCSSLDGCASEECFENFMEEEEDDEEEEEEEEEFQGVRNFNRSKVKNDICGRRRNASKNSRKRGRITYAEQEEEEKKKEDKEERGEEEENEEEEEEEEEIHGVRNFNRSKAKNGVWGKQKNASKTTRKRGRITHAEQLEEEEEMEEEEEVKEQEEKVERDGEWEGEEEQGDGDEEDEDEDFDFDDEDDEFTPEEEDYSDEEEELRGRKKKNNGMKMGKKVLQKRASVASTRGRKRRSSRASKKPLKNKKRKNGGLRRKVRCDNEDGFIDSCPAIKTTSRKKDAPKRRRLLLADSDSEFVSSGSSDFEYTISEEEREQMREAKKLCGSLRNNLRSSSFLTKNEEVGVHEDLHQQRKPSGRKGKEKIEEPQGRKGKEKVEGLKSEVGKQVCGVCLSEEDKRRVRGVLNCCTHYFCFACIMEWAKVESRCPLCKQRFKTISKPARSSTGIDLREVVIQVPERDQVYQPSEEELRSYIDPYEYVICSECHQGGDDGLMLLCDICDSPAHTYCVGLGREVPEGNWYCDGCRPVALGSSNSQDQERVSDPRITTQSMPVRPPPLQHVRESIDLNLTSSPRAAFNQGFGHLSSSRFTARSAEGASPVPGGAPTLSERRWIHRQIHQLLSIDRMTSATGRTNGISATSSTSNLHSSQIDQSRETATQYARTQDVGTSYHTFFEERLCNNSSPLMQDGALWPGLMGTPPVPDCEQVHQFSRSNVVTDGSLFPAVREESNFHIAMEQLQSMVKNHLKNLSQNIDLGHSTSKDITRSSMHTILAACGLEHKKSEVCTVPPPSVCPHIELMAGWQTSLIKGCCSSCFDSFVGDVVKRILDTRISSQWLRLGL